MGQEYAIASEHNNVSDLEFIQDIRVEGRPLLSEVEALGEMDEGLEREYIGGGREDVGTAEWDWILASMWPQELAYIRTTILGGKRSGPVTVRTKQNGGDYANYNATLTLPQRGGLKLERGGFYSDVKWTFTAGEEIE